MRTTNLTLALVAFLWLSLPLPAPAQWTNDPYNGMVSVCNAPGNQVGCIIGRLEGSGYTLVAWMDQRVTDQPRSYYQVLDQTGVPQLEPNGRPLIGDPYWYVGLAYLVPDGEGGLIGVFRDARDGYKDIYGQRFDSQGTPLWGPTGLPLVEWTVAASTSLKDVAYDDNGSFFIAWGISAASTDQYAQKFNVAGDRLWGDYGVPVSMAPGSQVWPQIVSDTRGGALVLWEDNRAGGYTYYLYAQHLDENGIPILTLNGIPLYSPGTSMQLSCGGLEGGEPDDQNGGVFVYTTPGASNLLRVIRVNGDGETQWVWDNGISAQHFVGDPLKNPADGTIWIAANDNRTGGYQSYLYHLDIDGNPLFNPAGIIGGETMAPTSDGAIAFDTYQNSLGTRIVAKRSNGAGRQIWECVVALARLYGGGAPGLCAISSSEDGDDGAVITMLDIRLYPSEIMNIAAQRVQWNGHLGNPIAAHETILADNWNCQSCQAINCSSHFQRQARSNWSCSTC